MLRVRLGENRIILCFHKFVGRVDGCWDMVSRDKDGSRHVAKARERLVLSEKRAWNSGRAAHRMLFPRPIAVPLVDEGLASIVELISSDHDCQSHG